MSVPPADLAALFVHFHTPELLARAWEALAADAAAAGLTVELAVVDNGSDEAGRRLLARLPGPRIVPDGNVGFAAGVGRGVAATRAARLLVVNPDVVVQPGAVAALAGALAEGAAAAGPRFTWDEAGAVLLPPTEERSWGAEVAKRRARLGEGARRLASRRWRRHARRHWTATAPLASRALSGALLALTRRAWEEVGPFDPGYRLYFEECDWLARAARRGLSTLYLPAARAVHLFNRSAAREPRAAAWFAASERRFLRRRHGPLGAAVLALLDRLPSRIGWPGPATPTGEVPEAALRAQARTGEAEAWIEVSPSPLGFPAAGTAVAPRDLAGWALPSEILAPLAPGRYRLALVEGSGDELAAWSLER